MTNQETRSAFLAPPEFGPAELGVEIVRAGRRQTTVDVRLIQSGLERVRAVATIGTLDLSEAGPATYGPDTKAPPIPGPDQGIDITTTNHGEGEGIALHDRVELRLHPDPGWLDDEPTGTPASMAGHALLMAATPIRSVSCCSPMGSLPPSSKPPGAASVTSRPSS